ncbi:hypothetical protein [Marinobacter sp.]|uniref:hypothetical protein n=1 Tax=Marinobacter sp. TaxID=50741 RepID=UPI002E87658B|nr:hypothetical protein [Pseudomonadota bacterium]
MSSSKLKTPDGRYLVVKGRLWRCANPELSGAAYRERVHRLMSARRDVHKAQKAGSNKQEREARTRVDAAKRALGERGPVWWSDGAPDYTQHKIENTPYADWYASLDEPEGQD